jgi:hypothetical protein
MTTTAERFELEFRRVATGRWHNWGLVFEQPEHAREQRDAAKRIPGQEHWQFRIVRVQTTREVIE